MPIYMDLHLTGDLSSKLMAEAHVRDLKFQREFHCRCMTYWFDEDSGNAFCLIEAPSADAVDQLHIRSHKQGPHRIIEVNEDKVRSFLGRIQDPDALYDIANPDLKIFEDTAFRTVVFIETQDLGLLRYNLGKERADRLISFRNEIIRNELENHNGSEVEMADKGFIASFVSAMDAVKCACEIQKKALLLTEELKMRIGIHAGMPVAQSEELFGDTLTVTRRLATIARMNQIVLSSIMKKLCKEDYPIGDMDPNYFWIMDSMEETILEQLMDTLEEHWQDPQFGTNDYCRKVGISRSQLYRKCMTLTGMSPNSWLREYRLQKSLDLLKSDNNITETTYSSGFNSPSYFTKCFHKRFGLQPMSYLKEAVHC